MDTTEGGSTALAISGEFTIFTAATLKQTLLDAVKQAGNGEVDIDLIEAHKWFNLAALAGSEEGQSLRAEVAEEMTAREIAEAQRLARAWLSATSANRYAA